MSWLRDEAESGLPREGSEIKLGTAALLAQSGVRTRVEKKRA